MVERMTLPSGKPSERAAQIVLTYTGGGCVGQGDRSENAT